MWISVAFPTCPRCNNNSHTCYHKNCPKGAPEPMEINPDTKDVRCPSCGRQWSIADTTYYCTCDYVFSAKDVSIEIEAIVANARLIAQEIERAAASRSRIDALTNHAIEITAEKTIKKRFGEKIWTVVKGILPALVSVVRKWLHI